MYFQLFIVQVEAGVECGFAIPGFADFLEDDEVECLKIVWTAPRSEEHTSELQSHSN